MGRGVGGSRGAKGERRREGASSGPIRILRLCAFVNFDPLRTMAV